MDLIASNLLLILCFVVGTGLIIAEAFIPGFGVAGVSGLILEIVAILMTGSRFGTGPALIALFAVLLVVGVTVFLSYKSAVNGRLSKSPLVLRSRERASAAAAGGKENPWLNREGTVVTSLRPAGFIEIDGERLSASSFGPFLEKGTRVRVVGQEGDHLTIRPLEEGKAPV